MPGSVEITLMIKDTFFNMLKNSGRFFPSYSRKLLSEARQHALVQVSQSVMFVYNAYQPKYYARTFQLMEGVGATYSGYWPKMYVSVFDTAVNRDEKWGDPGFPYPSVVEFGQKSGEQDPQSVAERVRNTLNGSDVAVSVFFAGKYGWHEMPPRPFMTIATIATGNWFYNKGTGRMMKAWARQTGTPRERTIRFAGRR